MRKVLLLVLGVLPTLVFASSQSEIDSLLSVMDSELGHVQDYLLQREDRITGMKGELRSDDLDDDRRVALLKDLFLAYRPYQADSAILYLQKRFDWAYEHNRQALINECRILQIDCYASIGLYLEATQVAEMIDTTQLSDGQYLDYLEAEAHLFGEMASYSQDRYFSHIHMLRSNQVNERLIARLDPSSTRYLKVLESVLWYHTPDKAMDINSQLLRSWAGNQQQMAMCCFMRGLEYERKRDLDNARIWYAKSAILDLRAGITDNGSSWKLAQLMNDKNDLERAYRYASYSMENALFYHARIRQAQVANTWAIIEQQYQDAMMTRQRNMKRTLIVVSVLSLIALAVMLVALIQHRKIARMQKQLQLANERLSQNNAILASSNANLNQQNESLAESNRAKEENIGYMLSLCSAYIDKLDKYRRSVGKRIAAQKLDELLHESKDPDFMQGELEEFYRNFDTKFLAIYPNFVQQFNDLLLEEERIVLKGNELLSPELRIFALIRLGIDNSSQIAQLLRYSVNTIYNYRAKVKNKAKGDREHFEDQVKQIGQA